MELPVFDFHSYLLDPAALRYNPCNDLIFPSVIHAAGCFSKPLAAYYLYYAPHDTPGGICLALADSPLGPWREHPENPIITREWQPHYQVSHISSPHAIFSPEQGRLLLYFHGENDTTRLASSVDGLHFDYQRICVNTSMFDNISEASYARIFRYPTGSRGSGYVMLFMGNDHGTRNIYLARSIDGRQWEARRSALITPPTHMGVTQIGSPWLFQYQQRNFVVYHGDKQIDRAELTGITSDLHISELDADLEQPRYLGVFLDRQKLPPDNTRVSDPCLLTVDGDTLLFVSVGPRLHQQLAVLRQRGRVSAID